MKYTKTTVHLDGKSAYDIVYERDFTGISESVSEILDSDVGLCVITDSNVERLYAASVKESLSKTFSRVILFSIPAGEQSKTLDTTRDIYKFLIENHFTRKDCLIALGGGVVGDITGFAAATFLRGIKFIQIPTTLLAMVDSSIGGKTGVDFDGYKNMVGAFHMPVLCYMNLSALKDLPGREFSAGMGEVLKHGLIKDAAYYEWTINNFSEILEYEEDILYEMIYKSNEIKKHVVESDPYEKGERALLNFGHTVGHAIEKQLKFTLKHGECVALGIIAASHISYQRGNISREDFYEIRDMFVPFGLPMTVEHIDIKQILEYTKSDKKNDGAVLKFVLLKKIGKAYVESNVTENEMAKALREIEWIEGE